MKVIINNNAYLVRFLHQNEKSNAERFTECVIAVDGNAFTGGYIGAGYAKVNPKDTFYKEKGRKISLSRALNNCKFPKEDRTVFWSEYRKWGKNRF